MTEPDTHSASQSSAILAVDLLRHYSFELGQYNLSQQVDIWLDYYPAQWLPTAIIEALYQGRYKAISVEQILNIWQRRGHPVYHFNHEFERLVCGNLPRPPEPASTKIPLPPCKPALSYRRMLLELPSVRAASQLERLSEIPSLKLALTCPENAVVEHRQPGTSELSTTNVCSPEAPCNAIAPSAISGKNGKSEPPLERTNREFKEFKQFKEGVVFGLSSGLAVRALNPRFRLEFSRYYKPNWLMFLSTHPSIDQFTPDTDDSSEFHNKLKAVVQPGQRSELG
ncbi:hypothetical protein OsccyDRAFT_1891 [Leptolyngbyaceae cyanobacterium JSC-12]|nr:hypothetical protein OsccyDRAFT_1891 [Leptolyngbyaceae cyanobacterium JSC-12]